MPRNSRVIDIGCGAGSVVKSIAADMREVVGLDFSEGMIRRAAEQNTAENLRFVVGDVLNLPAAGLGQFDVALSVRCLINLPDWEALRIFLAAPSWIMRFSVALSLMRHRNLRASISTSK